MRFLLLLVMLGNPVAWKEPVREYADLLEVNHKHTNGVHTFTQLIVWERHPGNGKYNVRDWAILDDRGEFHGYPTRGVSGVYESRLVKNGVNYSLRAPLYRESYTNHDPEVENGRVYPKHLRRALGTGKLPND